MEIYLLEDKLGGFWILDFKVTWDIPLEKESHK